jgi:broad specificity phosphatase PhoE/adenylylsulfate kinase-like enzyme
MDCKEAKAAAAAAKASLEGGVSVMAASLNSSSSMAPEPITKGSKHTMVICLVGLPARGKTYIGKKLKRWLSWGGYRTQLFNVGNVRRRRVGATKSAEFFSPSNADGVRVRRQCALEALDAVAKYFSAGGQIAVYDATNHSLKRREMIRDYLRKSEHHGELMWVESICNSSQIIDSNIRDTKLFSPDYKGMDPEDAVDDFKERIAQYIQKYATLEDDELASDDEECYVKLIDNRKIITCNCHGFLQGRIAFFLSNLRIGHSPIWMSRHGESVYNTLGLLGGDSALSARGQESAKALGPGDNTALRIPDGARRTRGCSTLKRTNHTADAINACLTPPLRKLQWKALDEIDAGLHDGLTYAQVEQKDPEGFAARQKDKLNYRYPRGESYTDMIARLEPVIFELERAPGPVIVIGHQAVLRTLYGYFVDAQLEAIPHLSIPLHTVIKLTPKTYHCIEQRFDLNVQTTAGAAAASASSSSSESKKT